MIADIAKILFSLGLFFIILKAIGKRQSGMYSKLYILHKAGPGLATILGFYHGLTIAPLSETYVLTGWILGFFLLVLMILGIKLGFSSEWIPFDEDQNKKFKRVRVLKWVLTLLVCAAMGAHYLII